MVQNLKLNYEISYQRLKSCSKTKLCGEFVQAVIDASQGAKARADAYRAGITVWTPPRPPGLWFLAMRSFPSQAQIETRPQSG